MEASKQVPMLLSSNSVLLYDYQKNFHDYSIPDLRDYVVMAALKTAVFFSATSDLWTSADNDPYLSFTVHFLLRLNTTQFVLADHSGLRILLTQEKQVIQFQKLMGLPPLNYLNIFIRFRRTFAEVITFGEASAHEFQPKFKLLVFKMNSSQNSNCRCSKSAIFILCHCCGYV